MNNAWNMNMVIKFFQNLYSAQRDTSLGGSFEGVHPMGLFWGMKPAPDVEHKHPRLVKWDAEEPFR